MRELEVYSREGCFLCEDMLEALRQFQDELDYTIRVYDIDEEEKLYARYNALVPLVSLNGRELMRYHFELATLRTALENAE